MRRRSNTLSFLLVLVVIGFARTAAADDRADSFGSGVEPFIGRTTFETLLDDLDVPEETRVVANLLYTDYLDALEAALESRRDARRQAGGERLEAALAGAVSVDMNELTALRRAVHGVIPSAWPTFDSAASALIDGVVSLGEGEREIAAVRDARRRMWLEPRATSSNAVGYAGEGLDVVRLAGKARRDGGPLAGVPKTLIDTALAPYVIEVEKLLAETATRDRQDRWNLQDARLVRDRTRQREIERTRTARWALWHATHRTASDAIGALVKEHGTAADLETWTRQFDRTCFPGVYRAAPAERQIAWIRANIEQPSILEAVAAVVREHDAERERLRREAVRILVEARTRHAFALTLETRPDVIEDRAVRTLHLDLLKNSGKQASLDRRVSSDLMSHLDEAARRRLERAIRKLS